MSRLADRLERDLREVAAAARPSLAAWESILARLGDEEESVDAVVLAAGVGPSKRPHWPAAVAAALALIVGSIAVLTTAGDDRSHFAADLTTTFASPRNGYSIQLPDAAAVTPATEPWGFSDQGDDAFDVVETDVATVFRGASIDLPERPSGFSDDEVDEFVSGLVEEVVPDGCGVPRSQRVEITIDGQSGSVAECANRIEATVVVGGRLYLFTLSHDRSDARAVFDAFLATIDMRPGTAVDFPNMTTRPTFVSPTYGYSFKYTGLLEPATERWDPSDQPLETFELDGVETGKSAYFSGASTAIPDGVSIDGWYDENVSPSGCGVPRSQQAEITIDGQSGRIAECGLIEATVVAGGRLYLFTLGHERNDAREWFDAWVATIDLTPETAAVP
jgi:hypothetical protein